MERGFKFEEIIGILAKLYHEGFKIIYKLGAFNLIKNVFSDIIQMMDKELLNSFRTLQTLDHYHNWGVKKCFQIV